MKKIYLTFVYKNLKLKSTYSLLFLFWGQILGIRWNIKRLFAYLPVSQNRGRNILEKSTNYILALKSMK